MPFTQGLIVPSFVAIGSVVLEKKVLNFINVFLLFRNHVHAEDRDISLQILDICHQTCGDHVGSFSLKQSSFNSIQKTTMFRMHTMNEHAFQVWYLCLHKQNFCVHDIKKKQHFKGKWSINCNDVFLYMCEERKTEREREKDGELLHW